MGEIARDVHWLDDHFAQNAKDEVWLPVVGTNGWIVITKDREIRHNFAKIDAIMVHRIPCFFLPKSLNGAGQIALVLNPRPHGEHLSVSVHALMEQSIFQVHCI